MEKWVISDVVRRRGKEEGRQVMRRRRDGGDGEVGVWRGRIVEGKIWNRRWSNGEAGRGKGMQREEEGLSDKELEGKSVEGCDGARGEETGRRWRGWFGVLQGRKTMEEPGGGGVRWMAGGGQR